MARFLAAIMAVVAAAALAVRAAPVQTQQRANITAYLIAHSHQDAGWLKTIDQYYEEVGVRPRILRARILASVLGPSSDRLRPLCHPRVDRRSSLGTTP